MQVPVNVVGQTHSTLERQLVELQDIIGRLEQLPAAKPQAARLLDVWHELKQIEGTLLALHRGALGDAASG